jgi:hypothetical protein
MSLGSNNGFVYYFFSLIKVYFKNIFGQIAKFTQIEISAIELIPILSDKSTIKGAKNAPYKLNASMNPAAVD